MMAGTGILNIIKTGLIPIKQKKISNYQSLAEKFSAYISILIFTVAVFMTVYSLSVEAPILKENISIKQQHAQQISTSFYFAYKNLIQQNQQEKIQAFIQKTLKRQKNLKFIMILDVYGKCIESSLPGIKGIPLSKSYFYEDIHFKKALSHSSLKEKDHLYLLKIPTWDHGHIVFGYILAPYNTLITELYLKKIILAVIFIIFGFLTGNILAKMVTKPLMELSNKADILSQGDFNVNIDVKTNDEVGKLSILFNTMAKNLQELYTQLEDKVAERTQELKNKNFELENAYKKLKQAQAKLVQQEKMSSLGLLVAGVAHELNNPINFIHGNIHHLKLYIQDLVELIDKYESLEKFLPEDIQQRITLLKQQIDYVFLKCDIEDLLSSCQEGSKRSQQIIMDLKNFSRIDEAALKEAHINEGINSTLNILKAEYRDRITIHKNYGDLPPILCYPGQLNQVFMNILANAVQAIQEQGDIYIQTTYDGINIEITVQDTGKGIEPKDLDKIFDPFYTTKDVGQGTGLGLTISYNIIEKHHGNLSVESEVHKGTTFTIKIPVNWYEKDNPSHN